MRKDISVDMEDRLRESTQNKQQEDFFSNEDKLRDTLEISSEQKST